MATPKRGESNHSSAASLFDRLPGSADELPRGVLRTGKIKKFHIEADAEFGPQIHVITESESSKTGKYEDWWTIGKPGSQEYKPSIRSKGGLFMQAIQDCTKTPIPWKDLLTHDEEGKALKHKDLYWSLELQEHDYGEFGVVEGRFPVLIQDKPIAEEDATASMKGKQDEDDDDDEDTEDDDDDGDEGDDDEIAGYPKDVVDVGLSLMEGKSDREFKTRAKKSRPLAEVKDDIADGTFQDALIEAGLVELDEDDNYALSDEDDDDD